MKFGTKGFRNTLSIIRYRTATNIPGFLYFLQDVSKVPRIQKSVYCLYLSRQQNEIQCKNSKKHAKYYKIGSHKKYLRLPILFTGCFKSTKNTDIYIFPL